MRGITMIACGVALPFLTAGLLTAAEPSSSAEKNVEALLRKLNDAFVKKDMETMRSLMSKDHVGILSCGDRLTREEQLSALDDLNLAGYTMHDVKLAMPAKDLIVVTYRAHQKGTWKGRALPSNLMVSAVWAHQDGKWLEVLYQETPAGPK